MVIQYFGDGCFRLQSGELSVLVNPTSNRLKADVILKTLSAPDALPLEGEVIFPGEYEFKGIEIQGIGLGEESTPKFIKTVYRVRFEDLNFAIMGHISHQVPTAVLDVLGEPDVLFLPTGSEHFIEPDEASKLIRQMEPKIVIPTYFKSPNDFLKVMGAKAEAQERFTFRKKDIADQKMQIILLEAKND